MSPLDPNAPSPYADPSVRPGVPHRAVGYRRGLEFAQALHAQAASPPHAYPSRLTPAGSPGCGCDGPGGPPPAPLTHLPSGAPHGADRVDVSRYHPWSWFGYGHHGGYGQGYFGAQADRFQSWVRSMFGYGGHR